MRNEERSELIKNTLTNCVELLEKKGGDYANADTLSNFKQVAAITGTTPEKVCNVLMAVKLSRINNLLDAPTVNNESVEDSYNDLINYALLAICCRKEAQLNRS